MKKAAEGYALGPTRVQLQNKDPRGWREFADQLAEHSTEGAALTMRGVQKRRPSLFDLVDKMKTITVPTLIMTGDEDWPCLEPGVLMKKNIPTAALVVMPKRRPQHQPRGAGAVQHAPRPTYFRPPTQAHGQSAIRARWRARSSAAETALSRVVTAVDQKIGAGHEARRIACKEDRGLGNFLRLAEPLKQVLRAGCSPCRFHVAEPLHQTIGLDRAWRERIAI